MKKFTLLAAAAVAALSMNAADLYVVGTFNEFNLASCMTVPEETDGGYTFTMQNTSKFKMSTKQSTEWDGENGFNAGAIGYSGTMEEPGTYTLEAWGEDQTLPWYGDWTVSVSSDLTSMTISTTTPKPTSAVFYIRGGMNGWGTDANWQFSNVKGDIWGLENVTISANTEFKIGDSGWGSINYGGQSGLVADQVYTLTSGGGNMTVAESYTGPVQFNLTTHEFILGEFPNAVEPDPDPEPVVRDLYVVGEAFGGWDTEHQVAMTRDEETNVYTLTVSSMPSGEWKIWDGDWGYSFGGDSNALVEGNNDAWFDSQSNFYAPESMVGKEVTLTFTLVEDSDFQGSSVASTLNVKVNDSSDPTAVSEIAVDNAAAEYYNLQGVRVANPENGIYVVRQGNKVYKVVVK